MCLFNYERRYTIQLWEHNTKESEKQILSQVQNPFEPQTLFPASLATLLGANDLKENRTVKYAEGEESMRRFSQLVAWEEPDTEKPQEGKSM